MRHDGIRLVVSTQSPKALPPELLELVSIAVLHYFYSQDWWTYLRQKLPLADDAWSRILVLGPGQAVVFASRSERNISPLTIRKRLTADFGSSRTSSQRKQ
jgi:DNA phosphorothioation-dependent restriction protein DptH